MQDVVSAMVLARLLVSPTSFIRSRRKIAGGGTAYVFSVGDLSSDKFWETFSDYFWGGIAEAWRMSRKGMRGEHSPNQTRPETF